MRNDRLQVDRVEVVASLLVLVLFIITVFVSSSSFARGLVSGWDH